jgi:hypothetical protein
MSRIDPKARLSPLWSEVSVRPPKSMAGSVS